MVLGLGLWRLLVLAFWMIYFLSFYPSGSGQSLVDGSLRMRYCSTNFSNKKLTWKLPPFGGVAALVAAAAVHPLAGLRGFGDAPGFRGHWRRCKEEDTTYRKRQTFVNVLGLILGSSQFQNAERLTLWEVFLFEERDEGSVRFGVGLSHVGEPTGIG